MAECIACQKALQGSWNMTTYGGPYDKTGRYLGIDDGYFLYSENPNWVFCYCKSCWQKNILSLSFVPKAEQLNSLQQQNTALQQQLTATQQNHTTLQQQHTSLQQQLSASQTESASYKKQLDEVNEKYNKSSNTSGITKLRDLFKQLTSSQVDTLHTHTSLRVDTFETAHSEQQLQCSTQFVQSTIVQLKSSVVAVIQLQKNALTQRTQAKESVFQTLTSADVPKTIIDTSIKPLETEIETIEADIKGWNTFLTVLTSPIEQREDASSIVEEVREKACDKPNDC